MVLIVALVAKHAHGADEGGDGVQRLILTGVAGEVDLDQKVWGKAPVAVTGH